MLRKKFDCGSLKIFQKNFYNRVSFSRVTSLQFSDCSFNIQRTHRRFFLEYIPKTICLKKNILIKNSMVDQHLDKVADRQYNTLNFIKKSGAHVRPSCRGGKSSNIFTGKPPWWSPFFAKVAGISYMDSTW